MAAAAAEVRSRVRAGEPRSRGRAVRLDVILVGRIRPLSLTCATSRPTAPRSAARHRPTASPRTPPRRRSSRRAPRMRRSTVSGFFIQLQAAAPLDSRSPFPGYAQTKDGRSEPERWEARNGTVGAHAVHPARHRPATAVPRCVAGGEGGTVLGRSNLVGKPMTQPCARTP